MVLLKYVRIRRGNFHRNTKKTCTKNAPTPPIRTHTHTLYTHAQSRRDLQGESSRHPLFNTRLRESSWWETGVRQLKWLPGSPPLLATPSILFYPPPCLQLHKLSPLLRGTGGKKPAVAEAEIITLQNSAATRSYTTSVRGEAVITRAQPRV